MRKIFYYLLAASFMACGGESEKKEETKSEPTITQGTPAMLTEDEKKAGWQLLFDGATTSGWHNYGGGSINPGWKVAEGNLLFDAAAKTDTAAADILTDEEFENFHLKLEWKVDTGGNSGIMFYVHEDSAHKKPYWTGPEMQVLDNERHPDAKITKHRAGDLYDLISSSKETVKPALEWNLAEIKCVNGKLDFYLNGENIVSTQMWDHNWNNMIANSKFKQWPGFGTFRKGRICLQDHGDNVWFRNIKIQKL